METNNQEKTMDWAYDNQQAAPADVAVLIIFFTRTEMLRRTFESVRKARPAHLLLYQDGPHDEEEAIGVEAARQVVADEAIDWPCDVRRNYHIRNAGHGPSAYAACRWSFSLFDKCIVIEEGFTPTPSFIPFCTTLLHRYENDQRIGMIADRSHEENTAQPYDYLFTTTMPTGGWASWRRVVDGWDGTYSVVDDAFDMRQLCQWAKANGQLSMVKKMCRYKEQGQPVCETVMWLHLALHSLLTIVPTRNSEPTLPLRHPPLVLYPRAIR